MVSAGRFFSHSDTIGDKSEITLLDVVHPQKMFFFIVQSSLCENLFKQAERADVLQFMFGADMFGQPLPPPINFPQVGQRFGPEDSDFPNSLERAAESDQLVVEFVVVVVFVVFCVALAISYHFRSLHCRYTVRRLRC